MLLSKERWVMHALLGEQATELECTMNEWAKGLGCISGVSNPLEKTLEVGADGTGQSSLPKQDTLREERGEVHSVSPDLFMETTYGPLISLHMISDST
jgi:hypothetical protein